MLYGDTKLPSRFWDKVYPEPNTSCWLWGAYTNKKGYGQYRVRGAVNTAHREAYMALVGGIPEAHQIDHLCRQRCCVNPSHLEAVTGIVNHLRGLRNQNTAKTECDYGHPLSGGNLYTYTSKAGAISRQCRICRVRRKAKYMAETYGDVDREKARIRSANYRNEILRRRNIREERRAA
jgi:hypothetical protein